jgi:hypothetical protein
MGESVDLAATGAFPLELLPEPTGPDSLDLTVSGLTVPEQLTSEGSNAKGFPTLAVVLPLAIAAALLIAACLWWFLVGKKRQESGDNGAEGDNGGMQALNEKRQNDERAQTESEAVIDAMPRDGKVAPEHETSTHLVG